MIKPKLKNNRNFVVITTLIMIALVSVGFSSWIAGNGVTSSNTSTMINMEIVANHVVFSEIIPYQKSEDGTFEKVDKIGDIKFAPENDVIDGESTSNSNNVEIPIEIELIVSNTLKLTQIEMNSNISIGDTVNNTEAGAFNDIEITTKNFFDREIGKYQYICLSDVDIDITSLTYEDYKIEGNATSYKKYIIDLTDKLQINYGNYFNNQSPQEFYNNAIGLALRNYQANQTEDNKNKYLLTVQEAYKELELMREKLGSQKINIEFTVSTEELSEVINY